jgi:hypothetical protein
MNDPDTKHYRSSEWSFALDIPRGWHAMPPVSTNSPNEVMRFVSKEDGSTNVLIIFRNVHEPKRTLKEVSDAVEQVLARNGFGNFAPGNTTIGSREALTLDFDRTKDGGTWSCRHYFVTDDTLRYTLGFGTNRKADMFGLHDRMAKSFEILPE